MDDRFHYAELAAAFARGRLGLPQATDGQTAIAQGRAAGLRLHKFKRNAELPRVRRVINVLRGLGPASLLDIGSGRGVFLWPLLDTFGELPVLAIDRDRHRARDIAAVTRGGVPRLRGLCTDARDLPLAAGAVDVVTALEVLEHVTEPEAAAREAVRVARRCVIVSVPSGPDANPGHIHFFSSGRLRGLLLEAGAARVSLDPVRGHTVAVASVA